jgi:DeoR family transcriptional regulator, suf operon transcriptional repressor
MDSPTGTRLEILGLLLRREFSSQELADRLGVSSTAIRQHLTTLEAVGLVMRRKVVTQPSRPTYLYRVSPQGMRVFPKRYDLLLTQLIEVLTERQGPDGAGAIIEAAARRVAERVPARLTRADGQDRWQQFLEWLEAEFAWQADVAEEAGHARRLTIHQCPFQDLSKTQPDVCGLFFGTLIRAVFEGTAVEHASVATMPACCAFVVRLAQPEPPAR